MQASNEHTDDLADREVVITRTIDAPSDLVWAAWIDPDRITNWWGPDGFSTTTREMDVRPGGVWRFVMHGPDGRNYPNRIVYEEVVPGERLVFEHDDDEQGVEPIRFHVTVTFEASERQTRLTMRQVFPSREERDRIMREYGALEGGLQTVARLAGHLADRAGGRRERLTIALPSAREVILRRTFAAPRELVFAALTRPEHIRRWWGCEGFELTACELDFRVGGAWRFVHRGPDGQEHPFCGEIREIVAPQRVVQTHIYDVDFIRDHPAIETIELAEVGGLTLLTDTILHDSQQSRDGHFSAGMEQGATESMDRLESLLAVLARA